MTYSKLDLCVLTSEQHERTCNYWYVVTTGSTSLTAFHSLHGLLTWLTERNLKLTKPLTAPGIYSYQKIEGSYTDEAHMSTDKFLALNPVLESRTLSNGDYVLARITEENEHRTVHTLNPNVRDRPVFDYTESREIYN